MNIETKTKTICTFLDTNKAEDINVVDVDGNKMLFDKAIICTSLSANHSKKLAEGVIACINGKCNKSQIEGQEGGQWLIADLGDVVVHIFLKEQRDEFSLDQYLSTVEKQSDHQN